MISAMLIKHPTFQMHTGATNRGRSGSGTIEAGIFSLGFLLVVIVYPKTPLES